MANEQEVASVERLATEGRIASDESAVEEPEFEANEVSDEEFELEPAGSAAAEGDAVEARCPIWMGYSEPQRCRRELHIAPDGVDETPVCLMHSKDSRKLSGLLLDTFWFESKPRFGTFNSGNGHWLCVGGGSLG